MHRRNFLAAALVGLAAPLVMQHAALGADPIKVVGIHDASGGLDIYGKPMIACLDFAVEEINAAGGLLGRPLELINYDPQSNIQLYTQFATQAATKDKAAVVHGGITSASREAIRPVLKRYNTLYFYNTQYEGGVCDRNTFCTGSTPAQNVERLVPHVHEEVGQEGLHPGGRLQLRPDHQQWVTKYVRESGGEVVGADFFPLDVTDFGATIKKIQAAKPDIVMSVLVGGAHISFYRQWAAAGMKQRDPDGLHHLRRRQREPVLIARGRRRHHRRLQLLPGARHPGQQGVPGEVQGQATAPRRPISAPSSRCTTYHGMHRWAERRREGGTIDRMKVIEALESGISFDGPPARPRSTRKTHHNILNVHLAR